jgi:hypothetical protein
MSMIIPTSWEGFDRMYTTERSGVEVSSYSSFVFGGFHVRTLARGPAVLADIFHEFPHVLHL